MKFSVIIPLYNKAPYIRKALESVLAQTYTDYELIIVDDGSTDSSAEIAEAFLQAPASRLIASSPNRLIRQANSGVSTARNAGVAQAHAEYIAFLDADDWWEPTYLEHMVQLISEYPDAGLYACNYVYYKPGKTHVALHIPTGYINYPKAYYESGVMPITSITAIIPRNVYDKMGGFPLGIKLGEDFLLWSKIALRYPVAFLNEPLAWYNNDVPATLRATRNLHAPEHHMLFRLELAFGNGDEVKGERLKAKGTDDGAKDDRLKVKGKKNGKAEIPASTLYTLHFTPTKDDWKSLLDKLRVNALLEYWLDKRYHNLAIEELKKVDWSLQSNSLKRIYKTPIWLLKMKLWVIQVGSCIKQVIIMLFAKR